LSNHPPHHLVSASLTQILISLLGISSISKADYLSAIAAIGGVKLGRVRKLFEVILIGTVPNVHFRFDIVMTFGALLPAALVLFGMMGSAKGKAPMVSRTAIPVIAENLVILLVIADPIPAAFSLDQFLGFTAEPTCL